MRHYRDWRGTGGARSANMRDACKVMMIMMRLCGPGPGPGKAWENRDACD